jgi:hypothetical protein
MTVGISGDYRPSKKVIEDLVAVAPDASWISQAHYYNSLLPGLQTIVGSLELKDPTEELKRGRQRPYGWKGPAKALCLPRRYSLLDGLFMAGTSRLTRIYNAAETCLAARCYRTRSGVRGFARIGADFFPALSSRRLHRGGSSIAGRYFETATGNLSLNLWGPALLAPGPDGALSTARFEILRESLQLAEVRVFIEKALTDPARTARLGKDVSTRAQNALDERVRDLLRVRTDRFWFVASGWQERSRDFYVLAANVRKKLEEK